MGPLICAGKGSAVKYYNLARSDGDLETFERILVKHIYPHRYAALKKNFRCFGFSCFAKRNL